MIELVIPGRPVPWQRVRTNQGRFFTPKETRDYEESVAWTARATRERIGDQPCKVTIELHSAKAVVRLEPVEGKPRKLKGDVDNYAKAILDGLQKGEMFDNDKQVVELTMIFVPSD